MALKLHSQFINIPQVIHGKTRYLVSKTIQ